MRLPKLRLRAPRVGPPRPTIRLRLTATYGVVFLITGAVLLTIGYALVRHNLGSRNHFRAELAKLGLPPPSELPLGRRFDLTPGSSQSRFAEAVRAQIQSDTLHSLVAQYLLALAAMTMVSVAAGWLLAGRALRPLRDITAAARRVSGQNLGERIALSGPSDELKELADTFDRMLGRLDSAFASQRHFVANASHELRTPLAIMRTEVDVALADSGASPSELRAMGEAVRETVDRCERLIEGLLVLARSEAAVGPDELVDLELLAADCITDLQARADDAQIEIVTDLEPARVRGDARLLERLIANLFDNGIRHNSVGGFLAVSTRTASGWVHLTVSNGGTAIDPSEVKTLTEPFRRLGRSYGGSGLGLSIVRSVAEAHGGRTTLQAPARGGLDIHVELPTLTPASDGEPERGPRRLQGTDRRSATTAPIPLLPGDAQ